MTGGPLGEVESYLDSLSRVRTAVQCRYPEIGGLTGFFRMYRSRDVKKSGTVGNGIDYSFHGSGCLFVDVDGAEVDVDFVAEGAEVFDPWRIRRFSTSVGGASKGDLEDILEECRSLVSQGRLTEPRSGWFSVVMHQIGS